MMNTPSIDFGPLTQLIGTWQGDKGMDVAPEPDGAEHNPYFETIVFTPVADVVENAESQQLAAIHYHQLVYRKATGKVFHDETGYWLWDAERNLVMQSLAIPRGVSLLAGGMHSGTADAKGKVTLDVNAALSDPDWPIIQSPFMRDNACTKSFQHQVSIGNDKLVYSETTLVDIYGKEFEHTDANELARA